MMLPPLRVRESFDTLYREQRADIEAHARSILRGRSDPADVAATAYTRLWAEIKDGRADRLHDRLVELATDIAQAEETRARREAKRIGYAMPNGDFFEDIDRVPELTPIAPGTRAAELAVSVPAPEPEDVRLWEAHDDAVRSLTPKQRDAYILTELRGLSTVEAAALLGITKQSLSERVVRARQSIATALTEGGVA